MFDSVWAQTPGPDGKTLREKTRLQAISQISSAVKAFGSGYSAVGVRATLPDTGSLKALIPSGSLANPNASQLILLSYRLTGFTALFSVTTPFTGGLIPDPDYKLTFDVEFFVSIVIPSGVGPVTSVASFNVENASIDADNIVAAVGDTVLSAINFLSGHIPADLTDGLYLISAALAGDVLATTGIRVVGAGGTVPPTVEAIDPATNLVEQSLVEGESLMLRRAGFRPGEVAVTIDAPAGQVLGAATADSAGSFQSAFRWPFGVIGQHKVLAEQSTGGPSLSAGTDLFVQPIPK